MCGVPITNKDGLTIALSLYQERRYSFWNGAHGAVSIRKTVLPGMAIPMLKIRRLIFNMEIAILGKDGLYIETLYWDCVSWWLRLIKYVIKLRNHVRLHLINSQITSLTIFYSTVYSGADKNNIKAPRHWPLWGEFTGDWWISRTKGH